MEPKDWIIFRAFEILGLHENRLQNFVTSDIVKYQLYIANKISSPSKMSLQQMLLNIEYNENG